MVKDLATAIAVIVASLAAIDYLLSKKQKEFLELRALAVWNWLSSQRMGRFIPYLWHPGFQMGLFILGHLCLIGLIWVRVIASPDFQAFWGNLHAPLPFVVLYALCTVGNYFQFHRPITDQLCESNTTLDYFITAGRGLFRYGIFASAAVLALVASKNLVTELAEVILPLAGAMILEIALVLLIIGSSVCWLGFVLVAMSLLFSLEFLLRRVIENHKGMVLGITGFLLALKTLLDLYSGK